MLRTIFFSLHGCWKNFKFELGTRELKHHMVLKLNSGRIVLSNEIYLTKTMPLYRDSQTFIVKIKLSLQGQTPESQFKVN